ncbi:hypothetical protein MY3296_003667 [Beauveria thailandica]
MLGSKLLLLSVPMLSAGQSDDALAKFGDVIPVLGQMARTDQDFVDGLALDLFSPKNRTLVVTNNTSPLPGNFVTGSTGEGFVNLSKYSWVIKFNESTNDLLAKIELPYDPEALAQQGIQVANTYVGALAADGKSWVVSETQRNVHMSENKTRIVKMTSLDGEYMLLGRKSQDSANIFVQYGQGATRTVNVTGGAYNTQDVEFVDGLRLRLGSAKPFALNADIPFGIDAQAIPKAYRSLIPSQDSYVWKMNSTSQASNVSVDISFPINQQMLQEQISDQQADHLHLLVARRDVNASAATRFQPLENQYFDKSQHKIEAMDLSRIDGQYVILFSTKKEDSSECTGEVEGGDEGAASDGQKQTASGDVHITQPLPTDSTPKTSLASEPLHRKTYKAASMSGYASGVLVTVQLLTMGLLL